MIHQVIKVYRLSFFLFVNICFEGSIRLRGGIEWSHSCMDVWETTVGRPPKSNAAMTLRFEGKEVDVIAASDIFGAMVAIGNCKSVTYSRGCLCVFVLPACQPELLSRPRAGGSLADEPGK